MLQVNAGLRMKTFLPSITGWACCWNSLFVYLALFRVLSGLYISVFDDRLHAPILAVDKIRLRQQTGILSFSTLERGPICPQLIAPGNLSVVLEKACELLP